LERRLNAFYADCDYVLAPNPAMADQMARDVVTFLAWASEPETEARRRMGIRVLVFLAIAGLLAYGVKRKIWAELKAKSA
jgi:ubiquinol-cytochrome c reductase cytochrome c1 subunit